MPTFSDFVRWGRDEIIARPEVADYELVLITDDLARIGVGEFDIDHAAREILIIQEGIDGE